jgi:shikimate kinase
MNIYLIGYRCSGKTTLGRALARRLEWEFVDMDDRLVAEAGQSITRMVAEKGWPYFRDLERALLERLATQNEMVVGTGGGIILEPANVATMRARGKVVWLQCRSDTVLRLIQRDPRSEQMRPALTDKGLREEIESTLQEREPLYRAAAHATIATDNFNVELLCTRIIQKLDHPIG